MAIMAKQNIAHPAIPLNDRRFDLGRTVEDAILPRVRKVGELYSVKDCEILHQSYEHCR